MKKLILIILILILAGYVFLHGFPEAVVNWVNDHQATTEEYAEEDDGDTDGDADGDSQTDGDSGKAVLTSANDIGLTNYDGIVAAMQASENDMFTQDNTTVRVEGGKVVEINRVYVP